MKNSVLEQRKLIADFFASIGVAWFAAGVIGVFVNRISETTDILRSLSWGIGFSYIFLSIGTVIIRNKVKK